MGLLTTLRRLLGRTSTPQRVAAVVVVMLAGIGIGFWLLRPEVVKGPVSGATPTPRPPPPPPRPTPGATPTASPTPAPDTDELNVTVLLVGRDWLAERVALGESGFNTDMLIVANIRADGSRIDLISLPRASVDVPLGDGSVWGRKINSLRAARGLPALKEAMSTALAMPLDYYAEMTLDDLARIVNAVAGVTGGLGAPLNDPHLHMSWRAGEN